MPGFRIPLVSYFFNGDSMGSLSAINLYGQLMALMVLCVVIQLYSYFLEFFFDKQLLIYFLHSSE